MNEEELDYTTVYITGVYDERKKWEQKIKNKIEEVAEQWNGKYVEYVTYRTKNNLLVKKDGVIEILQELLEEE